ncbi:MAG: TVP38/TMEM64 family protein [Hyphomicrobiaceae bacterium]
MGLPTEPTGTPIRFQWRRWLPLVVLAAAMATVLGMGWHRYLTFESIALHHAMLRAFIDQNLVLAVAAYALGYVAVVALSLPGGLVMTVAGGLLFGWIVAVPVITIAATLGATIVFLVARSSFGAALGERAGPWLAGLREGFRENALSYLLFLRLVPIFPFVVVNLAPAFLGVSLTTYVLGTFLGIIPATLAFAIVGSGLSSVVAAQSAAHAACLERAQADVTVVCKIGVDAGSLVTNELLAAFVLLGIVALIPVFAKRWSKRHAAH